MKICILSDSHDHRLLMEAAVRNAIKAGAEAVLHCGDVVAPSTLNPLVKFEIPIHVIHGNNTGDLVTLARLATRYNGSIHYYGQDAGIELAGKRIFLVHYPHYARAIAVTGDWDLVCCGHSHKALIDTINNIKLKTTTYINPGTVGGVASAPATWVLGNLKTMHFKLFTIDKAVEYNTTSTNPDYLS